MACVLGILGTSETIGTLGTINSIEMSVGAFLCFKFSTKGQSQMLPLMIYINKKNNKKQNIFFFIPEKSITFVRSKIK